MKIKYNATYFSRFLRCVFAIFLYAFSPALRPSNNESGPWARGLVRKRAFFAILSFCIFIFALALAAGRIVSRPA